MLYHASLSLIRRSAGQSTVRTCAYDARAAMRDLRTGKTHRFDRGKNSEPVRMEIFGWPGTDPAALWNAVERGEKRRDAQVAYRLIIAGQVELTDEQNVALYRDIFLWIQRKYKTCGTFAAHFKVGNPHAHGLIVTREVISDGAAVRFGKKFGDLNPFVSKSTEGISALRRVIAEITNRHLAMAGVKGTVDHRSNEAMGIKTEPGSHIGPRVMGTLRRIEREVSELGAAVELSESRLKEKWISLAEPSVAAVTIESLPTIEAAEAQLSIQTEELALAAKFIHWEQRKLQQAKEVNESSVTPTPAAPSSGVDKPKRDVESAMQQMTAGMKTLSRAKGHKRA